MNGTFLIALGAIWTEVRLSAPAETTAFCASGGFGSPLGAAVWQEYRESECQQREDSDECGHQMNCRGLDHCSSVAEVIRFRRCVSYDAIQHLDVGFQLPALATEVYLGDPTRFADGKALSSHVAMIPEEDSSGKRRRLGS